MAKTKVCKPANAKISWVDTHVLVSKLEKSFLLEAVGTLMAVKACGWDMLNDPKEKDKQLSIFALKDVEFVDLDIEE